MRWSPLRYTMSRVRAGGFSFLFKNSSASNPLNMRSMYPGGSADIHLVKIKGNITPGNKEFSLLRNMRFLQVMTRNMTVFWHVTPCFFWVGGEGETNLLSFRRICCTHFQVKGTKFIYQFSWSCLKNRLFTPGYTRSGSKHEEFRSLFLWTGLKMRNTKLTKYQHWNDIKCSPLNS